MYILTRSFILDTTNLDVTIIEILMDREGKQEGLKRTVRKMKDIPKTVLESIELLENQSHYEVQEIDQSSAKFFIEKEQSVLYLDKQIQDKNLH
ncbi:hypothetical protein BAMA_04900 [Bacillus manliponensis]|uniref:Uncharacterized protein n=2 Tax=Bacillus manliponensis TaxID=574376 RepID=A0A073JWB7_9BACI|nr:hypothetical protein [Bacillus manliponensis]KEK18590.1 hypothetical protein BAMA_04900 [Bacillus manliponensis]